MNSIQTMHFAGGIGMGQAVLAPAGLTVEEIARRFHASLEHLTAWVRAPAGHADEWIEIPRALWCTIRPKISGVIRFGYRMGKSELKSIFTLAISVLVSIVAPYLVPILGSVATAILGIAVTAGAALAANALFPSTPLGLGAESIERNTAIAIANVESDSNVLAKESYLPLIAGTRRISPPELAQPYPYLDEGIQTIKRIFAVDGHNELAEVQVDGAPVGDYPGITSEITSGAEAVGVPSLVDKISNVQAVGETLPNFSLDEVNLIDQDTPTDSEPRWTRFRTVYDEKLEEITLRLRLDSLVQSDSPGTLVSVPVRIRFRPRGSLGAWWNIPELRLTGDTAATIPLEVRLRWDGAFGLLTHEGDVAFQFFQRVPAVTAGPLSDGSTGDQWQAEAAFVAGAGLRDVQNVIADRNGVRITLDETEFPKGEYEWEVIRGLSFDAASFDPSTYMIGGVVYPFFQAYASGSTWRAVVPQGNFLARLSLDFAVSVVDRLPCQRPRTALLALKSRGQSVRNVTVLASRYVRDWDGAAWDALTITSNPATHYRQLLHDYLTHHGIDTALLADAEFVAWRAECIARGYEVSAVFSGATIKTVLSAIAAAGFARPRFSDGFGIDYFRDRSAERPVQTFSPRNATISLEWQQRPSPSGLRAAFQNEEDGYRDDELQINNPFYSSFRGYEVREYPMIARRALVHRRAMFDMLQEHYQSRRVWLVDAAIEGLICERGDMAGIVTDLLDDANSGARVREVLDTTVLRIDQFIPPESTESLFDVDDIFDPPDIFVEGEQSVCLLSTPTGTEMRTIVAAHEDIIRVDASFSSEDLKGAHIAIGPASRFTRRCIVSEVQRRSEERATVVCLDEAPEIWTEMQRRFG